MGTKNNPGEFDCYDKAEDDEPMFVLLARDPYAPTLVRIWADTERRFGSASKALEAQNCAAAMEAWREERDASTT